MKNLERNELYFAEEVNKIRGYEKTVAVHSEFFRKNIEEVKREVDAVLETLS